MIVTLEELKAYVRIDSREEDDILLGLRETAENLCCDIVRVPPEEMAEVPEPVKTAVLYAASYLYENREQADFNELVMTLRSLLFGQREEVF